MHRCLLPAANCPLIIVYSKKPQLDHCHATTTCSASGSPRATAYACAMRSVRKWCEVRSRRIEVITGEHVPRGDVRPAVRFGSKKDTEAARRSCR